MFFSEAVNRVLRRGSLLVCLNLIALGVMVLTTGTSQAAAGFARPLPQGAARMQVGPVSVLAGTQVAGQRVTPVPVRSEPMSGSGGSTIECVTKPSHAENVTLECPGDLLPTRESTIAVDPTDDKHMIAAAIDGDFGDQAIGFSTTFDGGRTWTIGDVPHGPDLSSFDAWLTFDLKHGVVVLSYQSLGPNENYCPPPGAQYVTVSTDGGLTWGDPVTVQQHRGCYGFSKNVHELNEAKTSTDNDPASPYYGRTWLTGGWIGCKNTTDCTYPIAEAYSDDGGATWTKPQFISGSNATYCSASPHPPLCDNAFPPAPVLGPDGTLYVTFLDESNGPAWEPGECCEDQLMVVSSKDGGRTWSPPVHIVDLEDGLGAGAGGSGGDYDSSEGFYGSRFTGIGLQSYEPASTLAIGRNGTLYVAFADNRNGLHDVKHPISNSDVFLMSSGDGGQTWTGPDVVSDAPGDQWRPTLAVSPVTGDLGVMFYDRSDDPDGKTMNVTLATGLPGHFDLETITTAPSHLSRDLWLSWNLSDCQNCVYHVGEYLGLAYGSDGTANMTWADLRRFVTLPDGRKGYAMNIDYASG